MLPSNQKPYGYGGHVTGRRVVYISPSSHDIRCGVCKCMMYMKEEKINENKFVEKFQHKGSPSKQNIQSNMKNIENLCKIERVFFLTLRNDFINIIS